MLKQPYEDFKTDFSNCIHVTAEYRKKGRKKEKKERKERRKRKERREEVGNKEGRKERKLIGTCKRLLLRPPVWATPNQRGFSEEC